MPLARAQWLTWQGSEMNFSDSGFPNLRAEVAFLIGNFDNISKYGLIPYIIYSDSPDHVQQARHSGGSGRTRGKESKGGLSMDFPGLLKGNMT